MGFDGLGKEMGEGFFDDVRLLLWTFSENTVVTAWE